MGARQLRESPELCTAPPQGQEGSKAPHCIAWKLQALLPAADAFGAAVQRGTTAGESQEQLLSVRSAFAH